MRNNEKDIERNIEKIEANTGNKIGNRAGRKILGMGMRKEPGIDGILVTVGLCIIALLLCVVMKESLAGFIDTIVRAMTDKAGAILNGTSL